MSPEQRARIDARSDLFSLGSVLYQMGTGELPFQRADTVATLVALSTQQPERPERYNPELPPAFCELIMALLAKDANRRPATARDVAQRLQQLEWEQAARSPLVVCANASEESDAKNHWAWKASGAAFATLVAPMLVAIGVKYTDVMLPTATTASPSQAAAPPTANQAAPVTAVTIRPAEHHPTSVVASPPEVRLFNGRDLTGFSKYLGPAAAGQKPLGKNHDRNTSSAFARAVARSGETIGAVSNRDHQNYHLIAEYKWGERTWHARVNRAMGGILLHAGKVDGVVREAWPSAFKCQISEGGTGDLVILAPEGNHRMQLVFPGEMRTLGNNVNTGRVFYYYRPDAPLTTFSSGVVRALTTDLDWHDEKGYRSKSAVGEPKDGWNTLECICQADRITILLNGRTINEAVHVQPQRGRVGIVSQGAEIFFRKIDLQPLAAVAAGGLRTRSRTSVRGLPDACSRRDEIPGLTPRAQKLRSARPGSDDFAAEACRALRQRLALTLLRRFPPCAFPPWNNFAMHASASKPAGLTTTQWLICLIASIGFAFDIYELLMMPLIATPALSDLLGVPADSPLVTQWIGIINWVSALCGGVFGLLGGWLIDRFGRKKILLASILIYGVSPLMAAMSTSVTELLIFRCTTFIGVCVEFVAAVAWLAELFPDRKQRETVLGVTQAFSSFGGLMVTVASVLCRQHALDLPALPSRCHSMVMLSGVTR